MKRRDKKLIEQAASNIKHHRMKKGWSQEKLQERTGLSIARYESGKKDMTLTTLGILSKHLSIESYELLK